MLRLDVLVGRAVLLGTSTHFLFAASAIAPPTSLGTNVGTVGEVTLEVGVCSLLEVGACANYDGLRGHHHRRLHHHHRLHSGLLAHHRLHGLHLLLAHHWLLSHHLLLHRLLHRLLHGLLHGLLHVHHFGLCNCHSCFRSHHVVCCLVGHLFLDSKLNTNINRH